MNAFSETNNELSQINPVVGIDALAYSQRQKGHSPEAIRNAVWNLICEEIEGDILDTGSGEGGWIKRLKQSSKINRIISVDIVDDGASLIEGVEFEIIDLSYDSLPCQDNSLDWIFAIEVLEHLANPRHFIQESSRCLRTGGRLVITTPCNDSLRAKISFLLRGYFPAFCDSDYSGSGHITPITELDLQRMANESDFQNAQFFYPLPGQLPKLSIKWQSLFPGLSGKLWSDCLIAILTK